MKSLNELNSIGIVKEIKTEFRLRRRLTSMGIVPGRKVRVASKGKRYLIMEVENSIIVMENRLASKILCSDDI